MGLMVFDIGGSAIKFGYWENQRLEQTGQFVTPDSFDKMVAAMQETMTTITGEIEGVAISSPGVVNGVTRRIDGLSAVKYLHGFPIFDALEEALGLPIAIENDANCAGIAEIELGIGKSVNHAVFLVLGTGVGGAIFINRQLYKGAHLFGGEFGLMLNRRHEILSNEGTMVKVANKYSKLTDQKVDGKRIFTLLEEQDELATALVSTMYNDIAHVLYNLQVALDPEMVIIGGGISARPEISREISQRLEKLLAQQGVEAILPEVVSCKFGNDANLIGAAMNFMNVHTL